MRPREGSLRIAAPGKAEPLWPSPLVLSYVEIEVLPTNTSVVYMGGPTVHAVLGGESGMPLLADGNRGDRVRLEDVDLNQLWFDVRTANDGVTWFGMQA